MVVMELHWCLPHQPSQERLLVKPKPGVVLQPLKAKKQPLIQDMIEEHV